MTDHDHDHRREHDHLVEPLYGALPKTEVAPRERGMRTGMWCVAIVVIALLIQYLAG